MEPSDLAPKKNRRICLTKAELETDAGKALVNLIQTIAKDGFVILDEVRVLKQFLNEPGVADLNAGPFLRELLERILDDLFIDDNEALELKQALLRIVPADVRESLKFTVQSQEPLDDPEGGEEQADDLDAATPQQIKYIKDLGGSVPRNLNTWDASELIGQLLKMTPPSPRQMMVARFWDRMDMATKSKPEVSHWMDQMLSDDPDRRKAWELFKRDVGDVGQMREPMAVPLGIGQKYLARVKGVLPQDKPSWPTVLQVGSSSRNELEADLCWIHGTVNEWREVYGCKRVSQAKVKAICAVIGSRLPDEDSGKFCDRFFPELARQFPETFTVKTIRKALGPGLLPNTELSRQENFNAPPQHGEAHWFVSLLFIAFCIGIIVYIVKAIR